VTVIAGVESGAPGALPRGWTKWRPYVLGGIAGGFLTVNAIAMVIVGGLTLFRARRLYAWWAKHVASAMLTFYGVGVRIHAREPFPSTQAVYISNHTSTLDLFVLVALGLPNCRFFLSGFLRKVVPLGIIATMMGTFFTVPQSRPDDRRRIFQRAARILRRTRESVYLSPEGGRITTGEIGHFNKGAFHLAIELQAPIVPFYIAIPADMDPVMGYNARAGTVDVHVMPTIDTEAWSVESLLTHKEAVRAQFVAFQEFLRCER
jgi:1-acyl-sn-glycerol-3-phosphate acyltransferase